MHLVLVDAYDSFTHNLAQAFAVAGAEVEVVRCDAVTAEQLVERRADAVVLGPGPGRPEDAGCLIPAVRALCGHTPLLGVCLGHQAITVAFGGRLLRHPPVHGSASSVHHDGEGLFAGLPRGARFGRYHSLGVDPATLPDPLRITAWSDDGVVMALRHRTAPLWGVQFHPESVLSPAGPDLVANFVAACRPSRLASAPEPRAAAC
ncbi:MAG: aminodeoxychorismate/anthranilate synthase component II [Myxococcota bacterium]